jgi:molybdopterin-guanine dinucleotide biosynthesis protein A
MGEDKCFLVYHDKPQCYYVYEMLQQFCAATFLSCNAAQSHKIDRHYRTLEDAPPFLDKGPATGLLTAFTAFPQNDFLVIGCDYPLLTEHEITHFLDNIPLASVAAAFYDEPGQGYQPVMAWYSSAAGDLLLKKPNASLKELLQMVQAYKHIPLNASSIISVDTITAREKVIQSTNFNQ